MNANSRIEILKQYITEDPADTFSRYALALEYIKAGEKSKALIYLTEIYQAHPTYLANYYQLGKVLESEGDISKAIKIYEAGITEARRQNDMHTLSELQSALDAIAE
jgi:tetratricopeptide (TPR) repeat protein